MTKPPLVSVICLCYNQKDFVAQAIRSVLAQTYQNIELIVVDDASTDGSKEVIRETLKDTNIQFIDIDENVGNCKAFNQGYRLSKGEYLIDLAADDLLLPARVELGINDFSNAPELAGVHFSDAFIINEAGEMLNTHYNRTPDGQISESVPQGNIYQELIARYFICPPTMMFKRKVLDRLHGYDETLSYEDFDFWIRSSRDFHYLFSQAPLVKKRIVKSSLSQQQTKLRNKHLQSTFHVCEKIYELNTTKDEDKALIRRCELEIRQCLKTLNFSLINSYLRLRKKTQRRLSSSSSIDK